MSRIKEKFVRFAPPSEECELLCADGELTGAEDFFPAGSDDDTGASGSTPGSQTAVPAPVAGGVGATLPPSSRLLAVHCPGDDRGDLRYIVQMADGSLGALLGGSHSFVVLSSAAFSSGVMVVSIGKWLVVNDRGKVLYALAGAGGYTPPAERPAVPAVEFTLQAARLPGYCETAGALPEARVQVPCPDALAEAARSWLSGGKVTSVSYYDKDFAAFRENVTRAVADAWRRYCAAAAGGGLYVGDVGAAGRLLLGGLTVSSGEPQLAVHPDGALQCRIAQASAGDGEACLTVMFSRRPASLVAVGDVPEYSGTWSGLSYSIDVSGPVTGLPETLELSPLGVLGGIDTDAVRRPGWTLDTVSPLLLAGARTEAVESLRMPQCGDIGAEGVYVSGQRLLAWSGDRLAVSALGMPAAPESLCRVEGEGILGVCASLRSITVEHFGDFPLYVMCRDGVRTATLRESSFRSGQLLSRDVPIEGTLPQGAATSVLMLSKRGLLSIEGTGVKVVAAYIGGGKKLAYHYATDCALLYDGSGETRYISLGKGRSGALGAAVTSAAELWPELWVLDAGGALRRMEAAAESGTAQMKSPARLRHEIVSRALKLSLPMTPKRLVEMRLAPAAGEGVTADVEASNDLVHWHRIARAPFGFTGRIRGSAWLCFRVRMNVGAVLPPGMLLRWRE